MKKNNKYRYPKTVRETIEGLRHYNIKDKEKLPSVTTILKATESEEKRASLAAWRERMGEETATRIVDESGARGVAGAGVPVGGERDDAAHDAAQVEHDPKNGEVLALALL